MTKQLIQKTLTLYKPVGMTPLEAIRTFQTKNPLYQNQTLSYAGRLDPMAEGILLVLVGEENKKRTLYENLDKTYEIDVLFGIKTDSYDILGIPEIQNPKTMTGEQITLTKDRIASFIGKYSQPYPPFSSKPVNGKPLYYWARKGLLKDVHIPIKEVTIKNILILGQREIQAISLLDYTQANLAKIHGNFRQESIKILWEKELEKYPNGEFTILSLHITCSSGTYMRGIAYELGENVGVGALALSIKRTAIGMPG